MAARGVAPSMDLPESARGSFPLPFFDGVEEGEAGGVLLFFGDASSLVARVPESWRCFFSRSAAQLVRFAIVWSFSSGYLSRRAVSSSSLRPR